ncbi:hydrogen peroxide-inducible genes activator [uncultured Roseobacter sp.]|uniref:hydrogen peroxide-inducible genes activator n=1 Tax=uncultured Roseobacter sp. TaxID=114847 RepID=UPI002621007F|nr:hydrogen peroxide-inducible genes activator [uncultured Roseobacter sp.]
MIGLTLKHMRYFQALAAHGHFGRAAEACNISQPALSLQIKELETLIGAPLVERSARQIRLTTLGEDFLARAQDITLRVEELENLQRSATGPLSGRLRLGVIPTVAPYLLPRIIGLLAARMPDLDLQPREAITGSLVEGLLDARLDIAVVALPISEPSLREFALFDEDFLLVRPATDGAKPVPSLSALRTMRLLLLEEGHCFREQALAFCDISGSAPQELMEGSSLSTLVQMVGAGIGVTLIPEMAVPLETRTADVAVTRFPAPCPQRTIGMVWRKTNPLGEQLMQIGALIRRAAETRATGGLSLGG